MAISPAHKFGQIIGDILEGSIEPLLEEFSKKHNLYFDKKRSRPARSGKKKVTWIDMFGNEHDLDFVFERGGSDTKIGKPVAFIESAWRRYTKHSRNKAQEIQGAILPLSVTHNKSCPFIGVVLAGVFTEGALEQLKSRGFSILYIPYDVVVKAFEIVGIDANYDEDTPDEEFSIKVKAFDELSNDEVNLIKMELLELKKEDVNKFKMELERSISREIEEILVIPLHGSIKSFDNIQEAIDFVGQFNTKKPEKNFVRFEVIVNYNNGDKIDAKFKDKDSAIEFLLDYQPIKYSPKI